MSHYFLHNVEWKSFRLDVSPRRSREMEKWKDGKYKDTRGTRAYTNAMEVWPDRSSQGIKKKSRFCPRAQREGRKKEKRIILFFPLPPLFLFFLSRSFPVLPSLDQNLFTDRGGNSPRTSGHLRKYPYFSTPRCVFFFVRARDKSQTCYSFPRNVNWGRNLNYNFSLIYSLFTI